jgi:SAM-dependent methyltransferase
VTSPPTPADLRFRAGLEVREALERQLEPLGRPAMAALRLLPGETVLDIGCGVGGTPRALAAAVGVGGRVVGFDIQQAVIDVARADPGLPDTIDWLCGDAQTYPFAPGSFDAAYSRFGVMVFSDPVAAFANIRRALRPGGRIAFVCWRGLAENELDALPLRAAAPALSAELVTEAAASGPFSFAELDAIRDVMARAGFTDVSIAPHDEVVGSGSLPAMVEVCSRVGALGKILRENPRLRHRATPLLEDALRALDGPDGPILRAATWVVVARTPG